MQRSAITDLCVLLCTACLSFMVVGAVFALDLKPTGGAQSDLFLWHLKSIEQYRTLPFFEAMVRQQSAMGPFNYAIFSQFNLGAPELRLIACGFLILSAFIFAATASPFLEAQNVRLPGQITVSPFVFCYVLFTALITLNPFILGPTVWANPDGLSVLMLALSGLAAVRVRNAIGAALLAGLFFALACLTRQILFPLSLLLLLILLRSHSPLTRAETIRLAAILLAPATAAGMLMLWHWRGLTPPDFTVHSGIKPANPVLPVGYIGVLGLIYGVLWLPVAARRAGLRSAVNQAIGIVDRRYYPAAAGFALLATALMATGLPGRGGGVFVKLVELVDGSVVFSLLCLFAGFIISVRLLGQSAFWIALFGLYLAAFGVKGDILYQKYFDPYFYLYIVAALLACGDVDVLQKALSFILPFMMALLAFSIVYYA